MVYGTHSPILELTKESSQVVGIRIDRRQELVPSLYSPRLPVGAPHMELV
jgi:hypothetical protein